MYFCLEKHEEKRANPVSRDCKTVKVDGENTTGVLVVGFLLFSVVVYSSPHRTCVLGCFSQYT